MATKTKIVHNGTVTSPVGGFVAGQAVGRVYLSDIRRRLDAPAELEATSGEDSYIDPNTTIEILETGDVYLSAQSGILKVMSDMGVFSLTFGVTS